MAWIAGSILTFLNGFSAYHYQVEGNDPTTDDYVKKAQYLERWDFLWATIGVIDWYHYNFTQSHKWKSELFPMANLVAIGGAVGTISLAFMAKNEVASESDTNWNKTFYSAIIASLTVITMSALTFKDIGLHGRQPRLPPPPQP